MTIGNTDERKERKWGEYFMIGFHREKKPDMQGVNLFVSILVCYPEISTVNYEPEHNTIHFTFAMNAIPNKLDYERVGHLLQESILTYHSLEGYKARRIEVYLEGQGHTAFFNVVRDVQSISRGEISLITALMRDNFGDILMTDPGQDDSDDVEADIIAHEDAIDHMIHTLKHTRLKSRLVGIREEGRVLVFNK